MTEMQTIKNAEREHRRPLNLCVVSSVKETHLFIADCQLAIANFALASLRNRTGGCCFVAVAPAL
jgi:hypothetical protein